MLDHDNFHLIFQGKVNLLVMFCVFLLFVVYF